MIVGVVAREELLAAVIWYEDQREGPLRPIDRAFWVVVSRDVRKAVAALHAASRR